MRRVIADCHPPLENPMLESLLIPTAIVALAEIGDKTQLLALLLGVVIRQE